MNFLMKMQMKIQAFCKCRILKRYRFSTFHGSIMWKRKEKDSCPFHLKLCLLWALCKLYRNSANNLDRKREKEPLLPPFPQLTSLFSKFRTFLSTMEMAEATGSPPSWITATCSGTGLGWLAELFFGGILLLCCSCGTERDRVVTGISVL